VVVHGNRRNFCSALVTIDPDAVPKWAEDHGKKGLSYAELTQDPDLRKLVEDKVTALNTTLASYETIKKFAILDEDFSLETGELTASLKVKRKVVEKQYSDILDSFYTGAIKEIS
jgi:long-chain acyl-CoA synthetase